MKFTGKQFIAVLAVLLMMGVVVAQSISSHIIFVVPSVQSFRLTMPGTEGYNTTSGENYSQYIAFNSSKNISATGNNIGKVFYDHINATRWADGDTQIDGTSGIFNYTNTGNINLTIKLGLLGALPMWGGDLNHTIRLYASNVSETGQGDWSEQACTVEGSAIDGEFENNCTFINTTASTIVVNLTSGQTSSIYLWADFVNLSYATWTRNASSVGTAS